MSREGYSVYIADGFADDCEGLIQRCSRVQTLDYATFCNIYKDMKFDGLYAGRMTPAEIAELSEEVLHVAKHYMVTDTSNFEESVAGLFLVYTLLNTQPFPMFAALRLIPDDMAAIERIQVVARSEKRSDVLYILGHVLIKGPCQFHATVRERGLEPGLRKYFGRTATIDRSGLRPKGVFQRQNNELDIIRLLRHMDRRYAEHKARIVGGRSLNYWDSGIVNGLDTSLRNLVNGITDEVAGPSAAGRSDHVNAIKDRAMKLTVNSVAHLTGVNERAKTSPTKPGSTSNQFVLPRPPPKIIRKRETMTSQCSNEWEVPIVNQYNTLLFYGQSCNNDSLQEKELTQIMSQTRLVLRKAHDGVSLDDGSQSSDLPELLPTENIESKCNGNEKLDMMMLDWSDDDIGHVDNNSSDDDGDIRHVNKDGEPQRAKTVIYVANNKTKGKKGSVGKKGDVDKMANGKTEKDLCQQKPSRKRKMPAKKSSKNEDKMNNVCQEKPSKKRKMSSKSSKNAKTKRRKGKVFVISDSSDSDSEIDLALDDSDDDLYSVTDDVENLQETIDDDIKRFENYKSPNNSVIESPKNPKNDTSQRRRSRTRKSETDDVVNLTELIEDDIDRLEKDKTTKKNENNKRSESRRSRTRKSETDDVVNLTETIEDDIDRLEKDKTPKVNENNKQSESRRYRTRKSETDDVVNLTETTEDDIDRLQDKTPKKNENNKQSESRRYRTRKSETDDVVNLTETTEDDIDRLQDKTPKKNENNKQSESRRYRNCKSNTDDVKKLTKTENKRSRTRKSETVPTNIENKDNNEKNRNNLDEIISQNLEIGAPKKTEIDKRETRRSRTRQSETDVPTGIDNQEKHREINKTPKNIKPKSDTQTDSRRSRTRKNVTKILSNVENDDKDNPEKVGKGIELEKDRKGIDDPEKGSKNTDDPEKGRKSIDEIISENLESGVPMLIQTDNGDEFIQIHILDNAKQSNVETVDKICCLHTRQVNTRNLPVKKLNSPKSEPTLPVRKPSTEKSPTKKENRLAKQNVLAEKQNSANTRSNLKDTTSLIDETQKSQKTSNTKQNSPKTLNNLETIERCTRSRIKDNQIRLKSLPDDVTITKIDKKTMSQRSSSRNMSPRRSPRAQSMAQLTLVKSPSVDEMIKKRKAPEVKWNAKGKASLKSKFKRMGMLPIANFKEDVSD